MTDDELARPPAFARTSPAGDWVASRYDDVQAILADGRFGVPEAGPPGAVGTISWLRASVSRFANGAEHQRRRARAVAELRPLHPHQLRRAAARRANTAIRQTARPGSRLDVMALLARRVPMAAMAAALGIARAEDAADAVIRIAPGYFPGADAAAQRVAGTATAQLVIMLGLDDDSGPARHGAARAARWALTSPRRAPAPPGPAPALRGLAVTPPGPAPASPSPAAGSVGSLAAPAGPLTASVSSSGQPVSSSGRADAPAGLDAALPADLDVIVARIALMVQGCDATAGLIGNALHFLQDGGPEVANWPTATVLDEVLRHRPVVRASGRIAREPVTVLGHQVHPGDRVRCDIQAASTDPAAPSTSNYPAPNFDRSRTNPACTGPAAAELGAASEPGPGEAGPANLTFGYGVRPCPGRPQALALATGVIDAVRGNCAFLPGQRVEYEPDQPLRIPLRLDVALR